MSTGERCWTPLTHALSRFDRKHLIFNQCSAYPLTHALSRFDRKGSNAGDGPFDRDPQAGGTQFPDRVRDEACASGQLGTKGLAHQGFPAP